jgi:coenzyme F420-reducing hydrogenase gamma subunit
VHGKGGYAAGVRVLGCIADLMFSTKLRDAARHLGHECEIVRRADDVSGRLADADLVVVDLGIASGGALEAVQAAREAGVATVAYGEHVRADVLQAARDAGADQVLTRFEFTKQLPALLGA